MAFADPASDQGGKAYFSDRQARCSFGQSARYTQTGTRLEKIAGHLLDRTFGSDQEGVITFDWVTSGSPVPIEWIKIIVAMAKERGLGAVSCRMATAHMPIS